MRKLILTTSILAMWTCSPTPSRITNSTVTVGEYVLVPRSALFFNGSQHGASSVIVLSDTTDICDHYRANGCALGAAGQPAGNFVVISVGSPLQVGDSNASAGCFGYDPLCRPTPPLAASFAPLSRGSAQFVFASNPCAGGGRSPCTGSTNALKYFSANSGSVSIATVSDSEVSGSYSVTLETGLSLKGTFAAPACPGLELTADFVPRCTQTATGDGGTRTVCACEGRTAIAECGAGPGSRPSLQCSCRALTGEESTCSGTSFLCCPVGVMPDGGR